MDITTSSRGFVVIASTGSAARRHPPGTEIEKLAAGSAGASRSESSSANASVLIASGASSPNATSTWNARPRSLKPNQ